MSEVAVKTDSQRPVELERVLGVMRQASRLLSLGRAKPLLAEPELGLVDWFILRALVALPAERAHLAGLSRACWADRAATRDAVGRLAALGLVSVEKRSSTYVTLEPAGADALARLDAAVAERFGPVAGDRTAKSAVTLLRSLADELARDGEAEAEGA